MTEKENDKINEIITNAVKKIYELGFDCDLYLSVQKYDNSFAKYQLASKGYGIIKQLDIKH